MSIQEEYMRAAIAQAKTAADQGEIPIGAVIVYENHIIASAHNMKESRKMISAHAEMLAIQQAEKRLDQMYLDECDLYVTLEPCMMCAGAVSQARIRRLYYGTPSDKSGSIHSLIQIKGIKHIGTYPKEVYSDILHEECADLLKSFFQKRRKDKQT